MVLDEAFKLSARDEVLQRPDIRKTGIHPNFWYPVARSDNVKTGKPHGVSFAGEPIVLVRTERGTCCLFCPLHSNDKVRSDIQWKNG
jgi:Phenylpropionate dioxygenase and related ring-hydroxylating dioxygenases, large terminal subunit